jgi:two-component system nitrogen regulation sensor histidine kinase NtrY
MSEAHNETFEVDELVRNCSLLFKNNTEELECDVEEGIRILADREQMRRVLINLLKNAEQSIPEGRQGVIRITVRKKEGKVEIRIRDNGQGIPENLREKIFQPNFTTKSSGMGLGLAICKRIIESMGGEIGFVSEVGVGTEFFIILDIVRA